MNCSEDNTYAAARVDSKTLFPALTYPNIQFFTPDLVVVSRLTSLHVGVRYHNGLIPTSLNQDLINHRRLCRTPLALALGTRKRRGQADRSTDKKQALALSVCPHNGPIVS
jgi:hypothetical protein